MITDPIITAVVLATALLATGPATQTSNQPPVPAAPAAPAMAPAPDAIIYLHQLPEPAELTNAAAAQGITVERITRTSAEVTVVYQGADRQVHTVAYQLLPVAGGSPTAACTTLTAVPAPGGFPTAACPVLTAIPTASPTVLYAAPTPAYYYDSSYYPWPWLGSVSFSGGLGYRYDNFGGGFRHFMGSPAVRHFAAVSGFRDFIGNPAVRHFGAVSGFRNFIGRGVFHYLGSGGGFHHR